MKTPMILGFFGYGQEKYSWFDGVNYLKSVQAAGGCLMVYNPRIMAEVDALVKSFDSLLLTGSYGDVFPALYGEAQREKTNAYDREWDEHGIALIHAFVKAKKPVYGTCFGCQLIAVAYGGALVQDIDTKAHPGHNSMEALHGVFVEEGSRLAGIFGSGRQTVNSTHHQVVKDAGKLKVTAMSEDGLIEAVEGEGVLGVQWHPERMRDSGGLRFFDALVAEARNSAP